MQRPARQRGRLIRDGSRWARRIGSDHADVAPQRSNTVLDVVAAPARLRERSTDRIAHSPVFVSYALREVSASQVVAHRDDRVGPTQDLVGHRSRELVVGIETQLLDHGSDVRIELGPQSGSVPDELTKTRLSDKSAVTAAAI